MTIVGAALALVHLLCRDDADAGDLRTFDTRDNRPFLRKRLIALAIVVCLVAAGILVSGLLVLGPFLERWLGNALGQPTLTAWAWWTCSGRYSSPGCSRVRVVAVPRPGRRATSWRLITPGAATAVVVWLVASGGFAFYAARFGSYNKAWGHSRPSS